jgi:MFS family permease
VTETGWGSRAWLTPSVMGIGFVVLAAGFGKFGAAAALGDVAEQFGESGTGETVAEQAGLSGTALGVGLATIRIASLASLVLASLADRLGRRRVLLTGAAVGLTVVAAASLSPSYWLFVGLFALSRPFLSTADTVSSVAVAEQTGTADRAKGLALLAACYAVGAGLVAVIRGVGSDVLGFRGVFALALIPLLLLPAVARRIREPDRYRAIEGVADKPLPVLGAITAPFRRQLAVVMTVVFAVGVITGPANSFFFVYAENVLDVSTAATAVVVVMAAPVGLAGLLAGRWGCDHLGRRPTAALGLLAIAVTGIVTYSGGRTTAIAGYLAGVTVGAVFVPAVGALALEPFPTEVRAAVGGWTGAAGVLGAVVGLAAFGAVADAGDEFSRAALLVFAPAAAAAALLAFVPETRGRELEDRISPPRPEPGARGGGPGAGVPTSSSGP